MPTIYQSYAARFHEIGYQPVPVFGKRVFLKDWARWSKEPMTEVEFSRIESLDMGVGGAAHGAGIGLVMGVGGLCAIDIDTDDERILKLLPQSPMTKRGQKGRTALVRNVGGVAVKTMRGLGPVEVLGIGAQTVIPPSVHPSTQKAYQWVEGSEIVPACELPEVDVAALFKRMEELCFTYTVTRPVKELLHPEQREMDDEDWIYDAGQHSEEQAERAGLTVAAGRNNYLTAVAYSIACNQNRGVLPLTMEEMTCKLISADDKVHAKHPRGPWLRDEGEGHRERGVEARAAAMIERALESSKRNGDYMEPINISIGGVKLSDMWRRLNSDGTDPGVGDGVNTDEDDEDEDNFRVSAFEENGKLPPSLSRRVSDAEYESLMSHVEFLNHWKGYVRILSPAYSPKLALGGGLAVLSAMAANLFTYKMNRSNHYIMNIAPTGAGKDAPQLAIKLLLGRLQAEGVSVSSTEAYKSASSIMMNFSVGRRMRLDVQDEIGRMMKGMGKPGHPLYGSVDLLCQLWSASKSSIGYQAARSREREDSLIANPSLTLLGTTTPVGFRDALTGDNVAQGLIPRLVTFHQERVKAEATPFEPPRRVEVPGVIVAMAKDFLSRKAMTRNGGVLVSLPEGAMGIPIEPEEVEADDTFEPEVMRIQRDMLDYTNAQADAGTTESDIIDILQRRREMIYKLALCWYVGQNERYKLNAEAARWAETIMAGSTDELGVMLGLKNRGLVQFMEIEIRKWVERARLGWKREDNLRYKVSELLTKRMGRDPAYREVTAVVQGLCQTVLEQRGVDSKGRKFYGVAARRSKTRT